ncbi:hypothetical protein GCM10009806_21150 [Microbacterium flavum]
MRIARTCSESTGRGLEAEFSGVSGQPAAGTATPKERVPENVIAGVCTPAAVVMLIIMSGTSFLYF